jgi:hypothetical protein
MSMKEISDAKWLYFKAVLFVVVGFMSAALLVLQQPDVRTVALIGISVWAFSRFYYFCFYVIERYIDRSFRFSGLASVAAYLLRALRRS